MNRPQLPKYVSRSEYTVELEKYCDVLERTLDKVCQKLVNMKNACIGCYDFESCPLIRECLKGINHCRGKGEWEE